MLLLLLPLLKPFNLHLPKTTTVVMLVKLVPNGASSQLRHGLMESEEIPELSLLLHLDKKMLKKHTRLNGNTSPLIQSIKALMSNLRMKLQLHLLKITTVVMLVKLVPNGD